MLTCAVLAPAGMPDAPYDSAAKPRPSSTRPTPNFTGPLGFQ